MKILLASSEVHPFSKTGGLADMVGALGKALATAGHEVAIVTPLYRGIRERFTGIQPTEYRVDVPLGAVQVQAGLMELKLGPRLTVFFVDQREFFHRLALYGENNSEYPDNPQRFIFFSKAVVHLARYHPWGKPDIVHVHDWPVGLVPVLLQHEEQATGWKAPRSVMTIHNLAYQGRFAGATFALTGLPRNHFTPAGVEFFGDVNCLKAAINYADHLTTVSPRYAREICTEAYGCGLDDILRARQGSLSGILNGVDYDEWNTHRNIHLRHPYSFRKMAGKAQNKHDLQRELGLPARAEVPLFATVTRLADQKGMDLLLAALEEMLATDIQFALLGSGDPALQAGYQRLANRHPSKVVARIGYDHALSHRIEAGCDFFVMPSRFEPCGLNQMYSLRYGAIPIVRRTGGLDDSVVDLTDEPERADGIKFTELRTRALATAIRKAIVLYQTPALLATMRRNGMTADFSWSRTTDAYTKVFQRALA